MNDGKRIGFCWDFYWDTKQSSPIIINIQRIFESVIAMLIYLNIYSTISSILRKEKMIDVLNASQLSFFSVMTTDTLAPKS